MGKLFIVIFVEDRANQMLFFMEKIYLKISIRKQMKVEIAI